ncbi:MAG: endolytic transglycosylase MltG [Candidatus Gottesmanbacteria bacterium]
MKSNNTLITRIVILLAVVLFTLAGGIAWWKNAMSPVDEKDITPISFVVPSGQGSKEISRRLASAGLVRSQIGFYLLVRFFNTDGQIQAGDFRLNKTMDARMIAKELTRGMMDVWLTIPEGWRSEEIATNVAKELNIPEKEFLIIAKEGYMFPDTYMIPQDATAGAVVQLLTDTFYEKVTSVMLADAKKAGLSTQSVIILASLVEREGKTSQDRPVIAGILLNRLNQDWPLQVDATLQYILGYQVKDKTWWKKELTDADKVIDSPYNTYKYSGLPPAPISNPGIEAIKSVIYPEKTDYMFYIHDKAGGVHYAKTIEEHEKNIADYLR